ncbi:DNA polymerase IV [Rarobacter incanus]|uniref:DNA polymerase IV n=1 Tax=Rarobacter incanus TaxID=153494 RepID=UPI001B8835DF|nr:DNA polymerase IV [Rarobacter incanus]
MDMDAFFAAVEIADDPHLRGKKLIVGGRERSVVLAASYEARGNGVHSAMPMAAARRLCPDATIVAPRMERYREVSRQVMAILHDITPVVEQVSVDEAYLDVTSVRKHWADVESMARAIRERVSEQLSITCSVGVGPSKLIAKLASTHSKPNGLLVIPAESKIEFVQALPVKALPGVGDRTAEILHSRGIDTVRELSATNPDALRYWLGVTGSLLFDLSWARDLRPVEPSRVEQSIGAERTFAQDLVASAELDRHLVDLAHRVAAQLRDKEFAATSVTVKVKSSTMAVVSRSRSLPAPSDRGGDIVEVARKLLRAAREGGAAVRLIGLRAEGLRSARAVGRQGTLDELQPGSIVDCTDSPARSFAVPPASTDVDDGPAKALDHSVDAIDRSIEALDRVRRRFGGGALAPASSILHKGK